MSIVHQICNRKHNCDAEVLEHAIQLAVEIAREGREGRKIGTLFVVSDENEVLKRSRNLILDPLYGHAEKRKKICDPDMRETIKELAQLDGAFVVAGNGVVISAARHIDASAKCIDLPLGPGTRHVAAASITRDTRAVAVLVSTSAVVRIFCKGNLIAEIVPEAWALSDQSFKIKGPRKERQVADLRIISRISEEGETDGR